MTSNEEQNLNKSLVSEHRVLISLEKVLQAFEIFTSSIFGSWIKNMEKNIVLSELRDSLLPKLLSGELAPNQLR
jgi:type I restriction enzyme S subunit